MTKKAIEKQQKLNRLRQRFASERRCKLCTPERNIVFGEGNPDAELMIIGEAPGQEEDKQGRPFVGRSGKLLNKALLMTGLKREDIYITNVVKCRPPHNRTPTPTEMLEGKHAALDEQIAIIQPKIICTLGAIALNCFFDTPQKITQVHGKKIARTYYTIIPLFHPAYILRNQRKATEWLSDLYQVKTELNNSTWINYKPKKINSI